ncbi:MAG: DUF5615 family PIN-like protein [candidate division KSB1 bacterium]
MKLLFDQNLSYKLCNRVREVFPGSSQVRLVGLDQKDDDEIRQYARQNEFVIVTQDADFSLLSLLYGAPPKVIWLRCGNQSTTFVEKVLRDHETEIHLFFADDKLSSLEIY